MGFDANAAFEAADEAVTALARSKHELLDAEAEEALVQARAYAEHLAGGGDPTDHPYPGRERSTGTTTSITTGYEGLIIVYREWNRARGSANPVLPFNARELWRFCESVAENVGTPIPFEKLKRGSFRSSDAILRVLFRFEEAGALVVRRTRVDGKVAFLVRERRPDDPPLGAYRQGSIPEEAS
jgi:hypothetical protein